MRELEFDFQHPVHYLQSGQFSAELGWRHHLFTHQADTEVIIGLSGSIQLAINDESFKVEAGDVLTVFPHESIVGTLATVTPSQFIWFHFIQNGEYRVAETVTRILPPTEIRLPRFFHLVRREKVLIAAQQLLDVAHSPYFSKLAVDYQTTMLLIELANAGWLAQHGTMSKQTSLNQIKEWIRIHMDQNLRVATVAEHFDLNPDYLTRLFKQELGISVKAYMNSVKLDWAKYLLLTTRLSIEKVSKRVYFQEPKYFMRFFKKQVQLTPSQYRNAYTHTFLNNQQVDPGIDVAKFIDEAEVKQR
ncbi:AraC family transcriptional regulator [Lapidilactobacillus luobeiensis]|uniref:AraC family transcriptional regulator n=1 Tax=Lapidilactobacillus luobeiensis TaxID=2950371 RepID=UPI0021C2E301|nr:AraC family transcriptional regulator [Lapidilactobacillus luobeiensis]